MSQNSSLMDTEPGGEQTQYEGEYSDMIPPKKEYGQFGRSSEGSNTNPYTHKSAFNASNTQGVTPADKIRYGQSIQEGGIGGKTMGMTGQANTEGGFGSRDAQSEEQDSFEKQRRAQGYGEGRDMDRNIGG